MQAHRLDALKGAGIEENAQCFVNTIEGKNQGAVEDAVVVNAAATLWCASKVDSIRDGIESARTAIKDGKAAQTLRDWRKNTGESVNH
jgi:anthranilate phosphoribosyltransferase